MVRSKQPNNPKRRIAPQEQLSAAERSDLLARARYVGSALHKRKAADYGFHPPVNPRPHKSVCDDLRVIGRREAERLMAEGIRHGMISACSAGQLPKFIWSVDQDGEAYEAKIDRNGYHGYRLDRDHESTMRAYVLDEWNRRR